MWHGMLSLALGKERDNIPLHKTHHFLCTATHKNICHRDTESQRF